MTWQAGPGRILIPGTCANLPGLQVGRSGTVPKIAGMGLRQTIAHYRVTGKLGEGGMGSDSMPAIT